VCSVCPSVLAGPEQHGGINGAIAAALMHATRPFFEVLTAFGETNNIFQLPLETGCNPPVPDECGVSVDHPLRSFRVKEMSKLDAGVEFLAPLLASKESNAQWWTDLAQECREWSLCDESTGAPKSWGLQEDGRRVRERIHAAQAALRSLRTAEAELLSSDKHSRQKIDIAAFSEVEHSVAMTEDKLSALVRSLLPFPANPSTSESVFLSHSILLDEYPVLKAHARIIADGCVTAAKATQGLRAEEMDFDHMARDPEWPVSKMVAGFGTEGVMLYIKRGLCITPLHDEIANSRALNFLTESSRGVALWIGVNAHDLKPVIGTKGIRKLMQETHAGRLLAIFHQHKIPWTYRWQLPGMTVMSPCGTGAMHFVVAVGVYMEQLALNVTTSARALQESLAFWKHQSATDDNSFLSTFLNFPGLWLQRQGVQLGLEAQLDALLRLVAFARSRGHTVRWQEWSAGPNALRQLFCAKCKDPRGLKHARWILSVQLNGLCIGCYMRRHADAPGPDPRWK
jgi:hypothetical protein